MSATKVTTLAAVLVAALGGGVALWAQPSSGTWAEQPAKETPAKVEAKKAV
jgi:hypothetical protein